MRLLVPTDFSENASNAAKYAIELAQSLGNSSVTLLNTYKLKYTNTSLFIDFDDSAKAYAQEELDEQKEQLINDYDGFSIDARLELGSLDDVINSLKDEYDLVIMGTRGRSGLEAILIGSETARVIGNTVLPTLAIPVGAEFDSVEKLFIALDLNEELKENEVAVLNQLTSNEKVVRLFHNYHDALEVSTAAEKEILSNFKEQFPNDKVLLDLAYADDNLDSIESAINTIKPHMVVVKAKHRNLIQSLFHRSVTERLSYHTKQPLLVLKESE